MAGGRGATGTRGAGVQRTGGSLQAERMCRMAWRMVWSRPRGAGSRSTAVRRNRTVRENPA